MKFFNSTKGYVVGGDINANTSTVLETNDFGSTWVLQNTNSDRQVAVALPSANVVYTAGLNGSMLKTPANVNGTLSINHTASNAKCGLNNGVIHISAVNGIGPYSYTWSPNASNDSIVNNLASGTYYVTVTDASCTPKIKSDTVIISNAGKPTANFSSLQNISCDGISSSFINNSIDATNFAWDFGNGHTSTTQAPTTSFANGGTYNISLVAINGTCNDTLIKTISVSGEDATELKTVSVFTPNNDGINDCFHPLLTGTLSDTLSPCVQLEVYDRWGSKLFESDTNQNCWDGMYNMQAASPGTYYYIARFRKSTVTGYVSLLR